ncbi:MAG: helix-turn-helix domain-containing protein [Phycisphaeraceae bacterium]|nr:helix-turn-helix domain-containing protein [Phycisphaeraceae bacterium]
MTWGAVPIAAIVDPAISRSALRVLGYLSWRQGNKKAAWPSIKCIADDLQLDTRTVQRSLDVLEEKGLIIRTYPDRQGRGSVITYAVIIKDGTATALPGKKGGTSVPKRAASRSKSRGCIRKNYNREYTTEEVDCFLNEFDQAHKLYPGEKRGRDTEFDDFTQKHSDWRDVLPLLKPAIDVQVQHREAETAAGRWTPNRKHFKTWLSKRCWEVELETQTDSENPLSTQPATDDKIEQLEALGVFDE